MNKQEAIKQAYGEHWEIVKDYVDEKGWCRGFWGSEFYKLNGYIKPRSEGTLWRPKSLQGIEDNNGWIKIESENDLPKSILDNFWFVIKNGKIIIIELIKDDPSRLYLQFKLDGITHYRQIEKPKPPIY